MTLCVLAQDEERLHGSDGWAGIALHGGRALCFLAYMPSATGAAVIVIVEIRIRPRRISNENEKNFETKRMSFLMVLVTVAIVR